MKPDFSALGSLDVHAVIVTAPGSDSDFVSRFFAPRAGVSWSVDQQARTVVRASVGLMYEPPGVPAGGFFA